jgi:phage repressor protein C with HTH and peptisase S24 domain
VSKHNKKQQDQHCPDHNSDQYEKFNSEVKGDLDGIVLGHLQARGDSMEGAGVMDGDLVLVEPMEMGDIENGDLVAARLGEEATVKRYFERDGNVVLEPANPHYAPILVGDGDDLAVLGKVTGLFRQLSHAPAAAAAG